MSNTVAGRFLFWILVVSRRRTCLMSSTSFFWVPRILLGCSDSEVVKAQSCYRWWVSSNGAQSLSKHVSFTVGAVRLLVPIDLFDPEDDVLSGKVTKETYHVSTSILFMWHFETSSPKISTPAVDQPKWDVNREHQECKTPAPLTKPMRVGTKVLFVCNRSCVDKYLSMCMRTKVHRWCNDSGLRDTHLWLQKMLFRHLNTCVKNEWWVPTRHGLTGLRRRVTLNDRYNKARFSWRPVGYDGLPWKATGKSRCRQRLSLVFFSKMPIFIVRGLSLTIHDKEDHLSGI